MRENLIITTNNILTIDEIAYNDVKMSLGKEFVLSKT